MKILGISGWKGRGHDGSACLVDDGKLVCMAEEERFTRKKHAAQTVPLNSVAYCLQETGLGMDDIDVVACGWDYPKLAKLRGEMWPYSESQMLEIWFPRHVFPRSRTPRLDLIPHHRAHAASAFYTSPFERAAIIVADGMGESAGTTLAAGVDDRISILREFPISDSLGVFYATVTEYVGFDWLDSGKTMGLAAYGEDMYGHDFLELTGEGYRFRLPDGNPFPNLSGIAVESKIAHLWEFVLRRVAGESNSTRREYIAMAGQVVRRSEVQSKEMNVAAMAQRVVEDVIGHLAALVTDQCGTRNLCIAGGVGFNCVANGKLVSDGIVDNIYVQPAAGDNGASLGAALEVASREGELVRSHLRSASWGPQFTDDQIAKLLNENGIQFYRPDDLSEAVADMLIEGKVVGWFQGRMEIGPRALGNRSILADPRSRQTARRVNEIKGREEWRPLAPSILEDRRRDYYQVDCTSPSMTLSFEVTPDVRDSVEGIVHVDGSTRPQTVTPEDNPPFHRLITAVEERTGVGLLLNTSFNLAGEPIVCTPTDALRSYYTSGLDALALGSYLLSK